MLEERIKSLLDSELEADNLLGWELIEAKQIPFKDVIDYVENNKVAIMWEKRYRWDGSKFVRSNAKYQQTISGAGLASFGGHGTTTGFDYSGTYYSDIPFKYTRHEIQKEKRLDKSRGLWQNIKSAFKSK